MLAVWTATAGAGELSGAAAIADAVLWGKEMPASALTADLPRNVQSQLNDYLQRERTFHSGITPPPGATDEERETYGRRVGIERVVFCLFPRGDSAKVAPQYALDVDIEPDWQGMPEMPRREAKFLDQLLADFGDEYLSIQSMELSTRKKYLGKFRKVLPPKKVGRFYQTENKLDVAVRYELSSLVPLAK